MVKLIAIGWTGGKVENITPFTVSRPNYFQITDALSMMVLGKYGVVINGNGGWYVKWNNHNVTEVSTAVADHALLVKKKGGYDYDPRKVTITRDDRVVRKPVRKRK